MTARIARLGIPLAVVAALIALRPEIATGTFSSATSVLKVVALLAAWVGFAFLVRKFVSHAVARTLIIAVAAIGLLAVTVAPYFRDKTVNDAFPVVVPTVPTVPTSPTTLAFAAAPAATTPVTVPTGPVQLARGALKGLAGHRGSGQAVLYRQPDGSHLIRLEDFDVSSVPAPVVYLVPGAGRERPGGGVNLGALRGNQGNLNISVPAGPDVSGAQTLLIWCEAFSVPVAAATTAG